jgi:isopentenyl-diphosphate delta-isomerase
MIGSNLVENEIDHVLLGLYDHNDNNSFKVNTDEVQDYKWVELDVLLGELKQNPELFTVWLEKVVGFLI